MYCKGSLHCSAVGLHRQSSSRQQQRVEGSRPELWGETGINGPRMMDQEAK